MEEEEKATVIREPGNTFLKPDVDGVRSVERSPAQRWNFGSHIGI